MSISKQISPMPTHLILPERGSNYSLPTGCVTTKLTRDQTGGAFTLREAIMASGQGPAPHSHPEEDESFYILEGSVSFWFESGVVEAPAGTFVHSPKGTLHAWKNNGASLARMLIFLFPAGFDLSDLSEGGKSGEIVPEERMAGAHTPNHITLPGGGERLGQRFGRVHFLISAAQTGGSYLLTESVLTPLGGMGGARAFHYHKNEDAAFYVLEGMISFYLPDRAPVQAMLGTLLYCPQGTPHAFENRSDRPARMLNLLTPGGNMESYFRGEARIVGPAPADAALSAPAPAPTAPQMADLAAVAARHGIESLNG